MSIPLQLSLALVLSAACGAIVISGAKSALSDDYKRDARCSVSVTYEYYEISAANSSEIEEELLTHGPRDSYGARRFAYTDWRVKWDWKRDPDGRVIVDSVELKCSAKIALPKLVKKAGLASDTSARWDSFIESTIAHEAQHVEHVERNASKIIARIQQIASVRGDVGGQSVAAKGSVSLTEAQRIVREVISEIRESDRKYDLKTHHGRSEGAWWSVKVH
jgi:predicted secreted Zn-dependent protease